MSLREEVFAQAYAKRFPDKPPYSKLPEREKREFRFYFESRGVIFNPRFGVTGRIGGYAALRNFTLPSEATEPEDRTAKIIRKAEEEEEKETAEEEELHKAVNPPAQVKADPARETAAKAELAKLQKEWPPAEEDTPEAGAAREDLLNQAMTILEPYAKMAARQHVGPHFSEEDAEEAAHDGLASWKNKVLRRIEQIRSGATNSKGQTLPDAFVGKKLGTNTERNLIADIGRFVFNVMQSERKTAANRARLVPTDPLASEHEAERGEDEPPVGKQVSYPGEETPVSQITGAEKTQDIYGMFRTLSRDLRRQASTEAADLLDAIIRMDTYDDRELATALGWSRRKVRNVRTVLGSYVKHRAKTHPELRRLTRVFGQAAEALCTKYAVLNLLLEGNFLPTRRSKSLTRIYEKFAL